MQVPRLDWDRVRDRVADFNSSGAPYYLAETALHEAFRRGLNPETVPLCVMAVNSFWNANVDKEPGALRDVCESTVVGLSEIIPAIAAIRAHALPIREDVGATLTQPACALLPRFLKSPTGKRTNYSFATKFLHWCCPSTLPIVDNMSVKTMNRLIGKRMIWVPGPNTTSNERRCTESYERVIRFYNEALTQLDEKERSNLEEHDFRTQPNGFQRPNTAVRILDKYLWMEEKRPKS